MTAPNPFELAERFDQKIISFLPAGWTLVISEAVSEGRQMARGDTGADRKVLRIGLWAAQVVVAVMFCMAGFMKLTQPIPQLSVMMPWTGQLPETFVRIIGVIDLAGGLGMILPALTRIQPRLTTLAALGCAVLQVLAIAFHVSRGEFSVLPLNFILLPLSAFVLWGRARRAPIAPRGTTV